MRLLSRYRRTNAVTFSNGNPNGGDYVRRSVGVEWCSASASANNKLIIPRRQLLATAAGALVLAAPAVIRTAEASGRRIKATAVTTTSSSTAFPGQPGNLVGYANEPKYPGSLSTGGTITGGSAGSPRTYSYLDFDAGVNGTEIPSHTRFVGCRFQSNCQGFFNVLLDNVGDIEFHYCSFTPRVALVGANPPGSVWPSGGAGVSSKTMVDGVNCTPGTQGYQYGTHISGTGQPGPILHDHCDFWGFGNASDIIDASTVQITYQDCWFHDAANFMPNDYHTDGPGYLNGGVPPKNIKVDHCTIASLGTTNGLAFQGSTVPYTNLVLTNNYLSGFGFTADPGHDLSVDSVTFTGNTFGTDVPWIFGPFGGRTGFTSANWHNNKFKVSQITSPIVDGNTTFLGGGTGDSGKFIYPNSTLSTTDF
jgi:hypothetical protein